ncbi:MAG TPA: hypothetical protein PLU87_19575 [Sedimentisphaerales bacterium]|nr:hypothetical protein [Sedimentisphaerales bacterium]HRS13362.1 hypothetical protein [Sedimentisphaerales bacterium]
MMLPKTINVPLDELDRAKSLDEVKRIVKRFMLEYRQSYERIYAALQTKADKE